MTRVVSNEIVGKQIAEVYPEAIISKDSNAILLNKQYLYRVAEYLKNTEGLEFDYLNFVTAVDYLEYFELVYRLVSLRYNQSIMLKTRCEDRDKPVVSSITSLWRAAMYQEREIYDLFGIEFYGHPDLRRLLLWEGFKGHPLRRDYL
jgi:NADH-quinone oxidoreductase subunit C